MRCIAAYLFETIDSVALVTRRTAVHRSAGLDHSSIDLLAFLAPTACRKSLAATISHFNLKVFVFIAIRPCSAGSGHSTASGLP